MQKLTTKILLFLSIGLFGGFLTSCDDNPELNWQPTLVSPLVKAVIDFDNQAALKDLSIDLNLGVTGLPITNAPGVPVPAFNNLSTTPETYNFTEPEFVAIGIDTLTLAGTITNPYGVEISEGANIIVRNQGETQALFTITTTSAMPPNGAYQFSEIVNSGELKNSITFQVTNISSPGSNGQPVDMTNNSFRLQAELGVPGIRYIDFAPGISGSFDNVNDFDLGLDDDSEEISGRITMQFTNQMPLNLNIQLEFLDEAEATLTTLANISIPAGTNTNPTTATEVIDGTETINSVQNAKKVRVRMNYDTNGFTSNVRINNADKLELLMSGNLQIKIDSN